MATTNVNFTIPDFTGDAGAGGEHGLVPAPATGDATKFLKGNGTWSAVTGFDPSGSAAAAQAAAIATAASDATTKANAAQAAAISTASGDATTKANAAQAAAIAASQPLDADLTAIAALTPTDGDTILRVAGAWLNRTMAQLQTALGLGTAAYVNTGTGATNVPTITQADARYAALNAPSFLTYSGGSQVYAVATLAAVNSTTFTFPSTGFYHVQYTILHDANATTTGANFNVAGTAVSDYLSILVAYRTDNSTAGRFGFPSNAFASAGAAGLPTTSSAVTTNNRASVDVWINVTTVGDISLLAASEVVVANGITVTHVDGFMKKEA